ncbi:MAG: hypothetical protein HY231_21265 [Acidobacteria bacterium]|nr:hypothetical protein [Acidobacteriota bacterium]
MAEKDVQIMPINSNILTGITIDELEDRLEMQLLGLFDVLALSQPNGLAENIFAYTAFQEVPRPSVLEGEGWQQALIL